MKKAIVTGITGQDAAYLSKHLLDQGYEVYGTSRRTSSLNFWRIKELGIENHPNLKIVNFDLTDMSSAFRLIETVNPDEVYNLASQSFVGVSFEQPIATSEITGFGPLYLLEAIRSLNKDIRFYQASTSEMFGKVQDIPQTENTKFYPRSPYGVAKLFAHWMTINYKESYDMFTSSGILFNHESPLRGLEFVTRKITDGVAKIFLNLKDCIELGNLDAKRDWGHAKDYVIGMHAMLNASEPDDYVLATGKTYTVRDFVSLAFKAAGFELEFSGKGLKEVGIDINSGKTLVKINPKFYRPNEVDILIGDFSKAKLKLGWEPKIELDELCSEMVSADIRRNKDAVSY